MDFEILLLTLCYVIIPFKFVIYNYSEEFGCFTKVRALFCKTTSCPVVLNSAR